MKPDALLSFFKESLILRRDDSLQFVAFINKKLYTKRKIGDQGMKIKEGYILDEIGDQKVAISLKCGENDFSEMIKLNEIGAFLWEKLSEEIEEEKLVEAVTEAYDIDSATARKDIRSFTETLEKNGILER